MKGIMIYGNPMWGDNARAIYCEYIDNASFEISRGTGESISCLEGETSKLSKTVCSKKDTYDFETGALIALMKMCGVDKVVRAFNEVFPKERYNTYIAKFEGKLHELKKDFDKVKDLEEFYKKNYEDVKEHYDKLGDRNKYLIDDINKKLEYIKEKDEEIKRLEASNCAKGILNGKLLKDYNTAQNAYEVMVEKSADLMVKVKKLEEENEKLKLDCEKLQHEHNLCLNSENALKYTVDSLNKSVDKLNKAIVGYKNDLYNTAKRCKDLEEENEKLKDELRLKEDAINEWKQTLREQNTKIGDLVCENEKLKLDCEKLQHGYVDSDDVPSGHWDGDILNMVFLPGRCCGKQYTALVDLFKKIDQKKVDAAYKEAYNTKLPLWQKEFFKQMCDIHKESKEKIELPRTLDINGVTYTTEWIKPLTKREEMWERILGVTKCSSVEIKVVKQDITTFLRELQDKMPEVRWNGSDCLPVDLSVPDWFKHDYIYFSLFRNYDKGNLRLCYDDKPHSWIRIKVDYLPPMRWDLFKKGRLAVKVTYDNYKEFYEACEKELGKKPMTVYTGEYTVSICKKDSLFQVYTVDHQKTTGKKIINWEDVR